MNKVIIIGLIAAVALTIILLPPITLTINSTKPPFHNIEVHSNSEKYSLGDTVHVKVKNTGNVPVKFSVSPGDTRIISTTTGEPLGPIGVSDLANTFVPGEEYEVKVPIPREDRSIIGSVFEISVRYSIDPDDFPDQEFSSLVFVETKNFEVIEN